MDTCDLISPYELADLLGVCYTTVWKMTKQNPTLAACAITTGYRRPRHRYSRTLLRQAGFLREVAAS